MNGRVEWVTSPNFKFHIVMLIQYFLKYKVHAVLCGVSLFILFTVHV